MRGPSVSEGIGSRFLSFSSLTKHSVMYFTPKASKVISGTEINNNHN